MKNINGFTLIEMIIVVTIIGILAALAIPAYLGQQRNATRTEAYKNLEALRLLEEEVYEEFANYAPSAGFCAKDNNNVAAIQGSLPGFTPGTGLNFSYCIQLDVDLAGAPTPNCFAARAYGNTGTRVDGETYSLDCNYNKNF